MGLDQYLYLIKRHYYGGRDGEPILVDGFPLEQQRLHVVTWHKNHWVHQWFCTHNKAANECYDVEIATSSLKALADNLEKWVDDPEVLPPVSKEFRGPFFGVCEDDDDYEEARDLHRTYAKDEVKQIRKAIEWLEQYEIGYNESLHETRYAIYKASW